MNNQGTNKGVSRRDFLKGTAAGIVGLASMGLLGACSTTMEPDPTEATGTPAPPAVNATPAPETPASSGKFIKGVCTEANWLEDAPQINESDITEIIEEDVIVIGGGHSGLLATLGALDEGAGVAVIETQPWRLYVDVEGSGANMGGWYGSDIGHVNSKWLINKGFGPYNPGEVAYEFVKRTVGRCDPDLIRKFTQNSGAMIDRMMEIYDSYADRRKEEDSAVMIANNFYGEENVTADFSNMTTYPMSITHCQHESVTEYPILCGDYKTWPCNIQFYGHQGNNIEYFLKYICYYTQENGATWYFEHTAVKLVQNDAGDVTGVLVEDVNNPGKYKQFNARKGVVMCAGDFKGNPDMCWALLNEYMEWADRNDMTVEDWAFTATRNGSGHKMLLWAGAMMETTPRGAMGRKSGPSSPFGASPFLQLNKFGKRFYNEAGTAIASAVIYRQPEGMACWVSDTKLFQTLFKGGLDHGAPDFGLEKANQAMYDTFAAIEVGNPEGSLVSGNALAGSINRPSIVFAAKTLDELADFLGYTGEYKQNFLDAVARYNEMCYAGQDTDYGKQKNLLIPIDEGPFYGAVSEINSKPSLGLVTLCGVVADNEFRVARNGNKEDPIKGLYTCGNCLGNRYGAEYATPMAGNSIGIAQTHGWLAGKNAANQV